LRYVGNDRKTDGNAVYTQNLRSDSIDGYVSEFVENEAFRQSHRVDNVMLTHEIISFSASENREVFTQSVIDNLAKEYIRLRGNKAVILAAGHFDKNHIHIHACVSALEYRTGKSIGLNKAQLKELKENFQQYHKIRYPELTKSFPRHGSREPQLTHGQWHAKQRDDMIEKVKGLFSKSASQNQFLGLLQNEGLYYYERAGKPQGIECEGARFRFSRLLGKDQLDSLPMDRTEEERALAEIRSTRERQKERDSLSRDIEDRAR